MKGTRKLSAVERTLALPGVERIARLPERDEMPETHVLLIPGEHALELVLGDYAFRMTPARALSVVVVLRRGLERLMAGGQDP